MTSDRSAHPLWSAALRLLGSPAFSAALTTAAIGTVVLTHSIRSVIGWPGLIATLAVLAVMAAGVTAVRRDQFEWQGILPVTLLAFVFWSAASIFWSQYQWATLSGIAYQVGVGFLAVFVAVGRDLIQIIRAFGDVFRVTLAASLVIELLSGIIFDTSIPFLGVAGNLASGGPIQGLFGSRNMLGIVTMLAVITFGIEGATRSVHRNTAIWSLILAGTAFVFTRSPVASFAGLVVALATIALLLIRRAPATDRPRWQIGLLVVAVTGGVTAYLSRTALLDAFNGGGELLVRLTLWRQTWTLASLNLTEGWGFVGTWRPDLLPFLALRTSNGRPATSALNAYIDVWFQLGAIGFVIFVALLGLALVRAWLVASNRRSVAHVWPAIVLVSLAVISLAESAVLVELCWFLLVVCTIKAAQELSWRQGMR